MNSSTELKRGLSDDDVLLLKEIYREERAAWVLILASAACQQLLAEARIRDIDVKRGLL